MRQTAVTIVRTVTGFVVALLAVTLLAGAVGGAWRVAFWSVAGMGPYAHGSLAAPGFQFGFGVPLPTVLAWVALALAPFAAGYLLYALAVELLGRREGGRDPGRYGAV